MLKSVLLHHFLLSKFLVFSFKFHRKRSVFSILFILSNIFVASCFIMCALERHVLLSMIVPCFFSSRRIYVCVLVFHIIVDNSIELMQLSFKHAIMQFSFHFALLPVSVCGSIILLTLLSPPDALSPSYLLSCR